MVMYSIGSFIRNLRFLKIFIRNRFLPADDVHKEFIPYEYFIDNCVFLMNRLCIPIRNIHKEFTLMYIRNLDIHKETFFFS